MQINRTEKEISEISLIMRDNKLKFYEKQPELTKNQKKFLKSIELRDKIKEI